MRSLAACLLSQRQGPRINSHPEEDEDRGQHQSTRMDAFSRNLHGLLLRQPGEHSVAPCG